MRFFKLNALLLALVFTIAAAALLFVAVRIFGSFTEFGTPLNFISWFIFWFVQLPCYYLPHEVGDVFCIPACLVQLWLFFLIGVTSVRYVSCNNNPKSLNSLLKNDFLFETF